MHNVRFSHPRGRSSLYEQQTREGCAVGYSLHPVTAFNALEHFAAKEELIFCSCEFRFNQFDIIAASDEEGCVVQYETNTAFGN